MSTKTTMNESNKMVSVVSKLLVAAFVLFCAMFSEQAAAIFAQLSGILLSNMKWFILLSITSICFF